MAISDNVRGGFVAGTLVHTPSGLRPIETLKVGDFVVSRHQEGGENRLSKILNVVTRSPQELLLLPFIPGIGDFDEWMIATPEEAQEDPGHPHWLIANRYLAFAFDQRIWKREHGWKTGQQDLNLANFAMALQDGRSALSGSCDEILLDGEPNYGWAPDVRGESGPRICFEDYGIRVVSTDFYQIETDEEIVDGPMRRPVFNIDVETWHTFFVGIDGIWVYDLTR